MQRRAGTGPVPVRSVALTVMSYMFTDVSYVLIMCFQILKIMSVALTVMSYMFTDVSYVLIMCFQILKIILMAALVFVFLCQI